MINFKAFRSNLQKNNSTLITGIDIGSSKICSAIARIQSSGELNILGYGCHPSKGIRDGMIIDMESLQESVAHAMHNAEELAQETVEKVFVSIPPSICKSKIVGIDLNIKGHPVTDNDLDKIIDQAVASVQEKTNSVVIHSIPLNYEVDSVSGIKDPVGMFGTSLKAKINLMYCPQAPLRNLSACVERSHLNVEGFVSSIYVIGLASLVPDELELGVTLLDIGSSSTSIGLFFNGSLTYVDSIPIGGSHITSDIARCFSTPILQAERLKLQYGSTNISPQEGRENINIPQIGDASINKQITKGELMEVVLSRTEEILEKVKEKIITHPAYDYVGNRLAITGGSSLLNGLVDTAEIILEKKARIARPNNVSGLSSDISIPSFSTCIGLLIHGQHQKGPYAMLDSRRRGTNALYIDKLQHWFKRKLHKK